MSTYKRQLQVARWSTVARRVQIDVQTNSHLSHRNARDHRLPTTSVRRRVVGVVHVTSRIVQSKTVSLDIRLRSERQGLHVGGDLEADDDGEKGILIRWKRVALLAKRE